jgi:hypothetical protein
MVAYLKKGHKMNYSHFGFEFAKGVVKYLGFILVAWIFLLFIYNYFGWFKDDTDSPNDFKRSGLFLYTDYGTGVQYLGNRHGGLTPRLNKDGSIYILNLEN